MAGPSDYLAAERTFLAWIRTGLALMGLGFVVARFGLFLQALAIGPSGRLVPSVVPSYGLSFWLGTAFILLGVAVNLLSVRNHFHMVDDLKSGRTGFARPSLLAVGVAITLAVVGLGIAIYLVSIRDPRQNGPSCSLVEHSWNAAAVAGDGQPSPDRAVSARQRPVRFSQPLKALTRIKVYRSKVDKSVAARVQCMTADG